MAENAEILMEVKNIICSIVFSCPFYLTVKQLCIDYRNIYGTDIPYQQFGYKTVVDFIDKISDVHMEWIPHLNDFMLRKVYIPSSQHSPESVNRRKSDEIKMELKNSAIFSSSYLSENSFLPDRNLLVSPETSSMYSSFQNNRLNNFLRNELCKLIPLKIKSQIRELLRVFPDGIFLDDFTSFFKAYFQMDFPLERLGFHTLKDCLRCIPHIVEFDCENDSIVRSNSRKIFVRNDKSSKILNEKSNTEVKLEVPYVTEENSDTKHDDFKTIGYETNTMYNFDKNSDKKITFNQELPHLLKFNMNINDTDSDLQLLQEESIESKSTPFHNNDVKLSEENKTELCEKWKESSTQFGLKIKSWKTISRDSSDVEKSIETSIKDLKLSPNIHNNKTFLVNEVDISEDLLKQEFKKVNVITDEVKQEFKKVLSSYPDGILASNFLDYYSNITKKYLLLSDFGFNNMVELAYSFPEIFNICHSYYSKCNCLLYSSDRFKLNNFKSNFTCTHTINTHFDDLLKTNVMKLLTKVKKIHLEDFEKIYRITFKTELPWAYLDYDTIEGFVLELADEIPIKLSSERETFFISLNSERQFMESMDSIELSCKIHPDFATSDDTYTTQLFPENFTKYIPVFVTNIHNPDEIWIQLKGKTTSEALENLKKNLQTVYNDKEYDKYKIPEELFVVNNICAALLPFDDNWHRGIISKILPKDSVEIFYVDYGRYCIIQKRFLRLLKKEFLILPTQAIKGRLANIQPVNKMEWCNKAKQRLLELCIGKPLVALMINSRIKDRLSLCLCDISGNEDIHINDVLIKENLAVPFNDLIDPPIDQNFKSNLTSCKIFDNFSDKYEDIIDDEFEHQLLKTSEDFRIIEIYLEEFSNIHVIILNKKPYVCSEDIASLFLIENLESILLSKKIFIPYVPLNRYNNERLFMELSKYKVRGIKEDSNQIIIYTLKDLIEILVCLSHPSLHLKNEIEEKLKEFYKH